jgi:hypothetical protein
MHCATTAKCLLRFIWSRPESAGSPVRSHLTQSLVLLLADGVAGADAESEGLEAGTSAVFEGSLVSAGLDSPLDSTFEPPLLGA